MKNYLIIFSLIIFNPNIIIAQGEHKPIMLDFSISECKENCFIKADLISTFNTGDTLLIEAGVNLNCCGNFQGNINYWTEDILNLIVQKQPDKDGNSSFCNCNCYYEVKYKILNADSLPKTVLINGATFEENRDDAGWIEAEGPRTRSK